LAASAPRAGVAPALAGRIQAESGEGIAQAQVCASCADPDCDPIDPPRVQCVSSDARGEYAWRSLAPGVYRLAASAVGFEPTVAREDDERIVIQAGSSLRRDLTLRPGGASLAGTVLDATGGPVPLARIQAIQGDGTQLSMSVLSDEQGHFALSLRPGAATVRAQAEGYASAARSTYVPNTQLELRLTPEASLSGTVVSALDGRALAGLEVIAFKHSPLMLVDGDGRALSATDGSFSLRGLSSGTYRVQARSPHWVGAATQSVTLAIAEPGGPVRIAARPAVSVAGTVHIARTSRPCPGGTIFLGSAELEKKDAFAASSPLTADGAFRFVGVPAGTYALRVECRDCIAREFPSIRVADQEVEALELEVESGVVLTGKVVDAAGRPLAERAVSLVFEASAADAALAMSARSDADGKFRLNGLVPGAYLVRAGDEEQTEAQRVELAVGRGPVEVTLVVPAAGALRIVVDGADERTRATLSVSASSQFGEQRAQYSRDGSYLVRDLRAGLYIVSANDGKGPTLSQRLQLAQGEQAEVHLVLPKQQGVLSGRVVDGEGNPVSDVWVRASRSTSSLYEGAPGEPVLTDADGNFELTELARSETYDVEAYLSQQTKAISRGLRPGQQITLRVEAREQNLDGRRQL
jgi:protocatechuate 3,4-dioxygenase beta subunit